MKVPISGTVPYGMSEVAITWLKKDGDRVAKYDPILRYENEKAELDLEAPADGILYIAEGMAMQPGEEKHLLQKPSSIKPTADNPKPGWDLIMGWIVDEEGVRSSDEAAPVAATLEATPIPPATPAEEPEHADSKTAPPSREIANRHAPLASPRIRQIARERGFNLGNIKGSGPDGEVLLRDINGILPRSTDVAGAEARTAVPAPASVSDNEYTVEPMDPFSLRSAIAKNMIQSAHCIAMASTEVRIDFRHILEAHRIFDLMLSQGRTDLGQTRPYLRLEILVIEGILRALAGGHHKLNAVWGCEHFPEFRNGIKIWRHVNLGIAYQRDDGLVVPVLKRMEHADYREIGDRLFALYANMREGNMKRADFEGGTFTFNNAGALGMDGGRSIVIHGQSVICSLHRVESRDVSSPYYGYGILGASFDHAIHDGAPIASFLKEVRDFIQTMKPADFVAHFCNAMEIERL